MAKLSTAARKRIPSSEFGLPKTRQYPEENPAHARDAEARASEELAKGNLTPAQAAEIRHKAAQVLGTSDSTYHNK